MSAVGGMSVGVRLACWGGVVTEGVAVRPPVASRVDCGVAVAGARVAVARGVAVIWPAAVGCTSLVSGKAEVDVTTTIQGVCVGGGSVGTGVPPQAARRARDRTRTRICFMSICPGALEIVDRLVKGGRLFLVEPGTRLDVLRQCRLRVPHVAHEGLLKALDVA